MIFNSFQFVVFFTVVIALYWRLDLRWQNRFLLVMSYVFYGWWDWRFLGLLAFSTVVDFFVGRALGRTSAKTTRKRLLWVSMGVNLGVLGFFKYFGFFASSLENMLEVAGVPWLAPTLGVVLPVGISFYTFQSMSYTIDVYRRDLKPVERFDDFALYVSYFPQLVAGPIERATRLMPQITTARARPGRSDVANSLALIVVGLVKKVVVADIAADVTNDVFSRSGEAGVIELLLGVYCFALQIYGDFSGYSDMARGVSGLLGINLIVNFDQPYFSPTVTQFWRRWHISLSNWLRDYLYIPLGGNRQGPRRTYINLALTMLLGGLWHGAAWTFVVWGALQGIYLMAERRLDWGDAPSGRVALVGRTFLTFNLICFAWIFFRAESFGQAADVIAGIATLRGGEFPLLGFLNFFLPGLIIIVFLDRLQMRTASEAGIPSLRPTFQGALYALGAVLVLLASGGAPVPFVYFQF